MNDAEYEIFQANTVWWSLPQIKGWVGLCGISHDNMPCPSDGRYYIIQGEVSKPTNSMGPFIKKEDAEKWAIQLNWTVCTVEALYKALYLDKKPSKNG